MFVWRNLNKSSNKGKLAQSLDITFHIYFFCSPFYCFSVSSALFGSSVEREVGFLAPNRSLFLCQAINDIWQCYRDHLLALGTQLLKNTWQKYTKIVWRENTKIQIETNYYCYLKCIPPTIDTKALEFGSQNFLSAWKLRNFPWERSGSFQSAISMSFPELSENILVVLLRKYHEIHRRCKENIS